MSDFDLSRYPVSIQNDFFDELSTASDVVMKAISLGITNANAATDLAFFKANSERMTGLKGKPIDMQERGADTLVKAWELWHFLVSNFVSNRVAYEGRLFLPLGISNQKLEYLKGLISEHAKGTSADFKHAVTTIGKKDKKVLSYLLTQSPSRFKNKEMFWVLSDFLADTDTREASKGRFSLTAGDKIFENLKVEFEKMKSVRKREKKKKPWCLNFIVNVAMGTFLSDDPDYQRKLKVVTDRYAEIKSYRDEREVLNKGTLSLFAAELQLENMVGPTLYSKWNKKRGSRVDYLPSPLDYINNKIIKNKPGWYYFLIGKNSYHTQVIGVRVSRGKKEFVIFQDTGLSRNVSVDHMEQAYKDWYKRISPGHRLWLVYSQ